MKQLNTKNNQDCKQGSYGKVKIHKLSSLSILESLLMNPSELSAIFRFKCLGGLPGVNKGVLATPLGYYRDPISLDKVSRSFAAVIRQLPDELALPICVFYLVLRVLDTIEDDMNIEKFRIVARRIRV
eukprot:GSMAST32.ASY1.ANO1.1641.1 assembled CDS